MRILRYLRLDLLAIKPYLTLKNLLLLLVVGGFVSYSTRDGIALMSIVLFFGVVYASYPFAVGEQNGIDTLYCTLPGSRHDVVAGRYLYAVLICLCFGIGGLLLSGGLSLLLGYAFSLAQAVVVLASVFVVAVLMLSIQLPIYFKLGYMKAKLIAYLPMLLIAGLIALLADKTGAIVRVAGWGAQNAAALAAVAVLLVVALLCGSCLVSMRLYGSREF